MNTQLKLNRKAALAACILATAIWLPLATQAQDSPKTTGHAPGSHMRMENWSRHHAMHGSPNATDCSHSNDNLAYLPKSGYGNVGPGAGFAETDPASQFTPGNAGGLRSANLRVRQASVGFAEIDPAALTPVAGQSISEQAPGRIQQTRVGFAESDPAANSRWPGEGTQSRHFAACPHADGKRMVSGVSGMMSAGRVPGRS